MPNPFHHYLKTSHHAVSLNRRRVGKNLRRLAWAIDGDGLVLGINKPPLLNSIRNPLFHLLFEFGESSFGERSSMMKLEG
jgi:hypothetical protein